MFEGRYLQEELEYIWDYSKKTGFAQYINDDNKECILYLTCVPNFH